MPGKVKHDYALGHTARGFYHFFDSILTALEQVYVLQGGSRTGKSKVMKDIAETMLGRGLSVEQLHSASVAGALDGIIITELKLGLFDGTVLHFSRLYELGAIGHTVNVESAWDMDVLNTHAVAIHDFREQINACHNEAHAIFQEALAIHDDELEQIYFQYLDMAEANAYTQKLIAQFFQNERREKQATVRHRFLGAATPQGAANYISNLTADISDRYFIKGPPGSGKSHMLTEIGREAEKRGFDVEIYHCGFDPHSLDMVLLPERAIAIFDSTPPHEHFPERAGDHIIDMFAHAVDPIVEEKRVREIYDTHARYKAKMKEGIAHLAKAGTIHDQLETLFAGALDPNKLASLQLDLQNEIDHYAMNSH